MLRSWIVVLLAYNNSVNDAKVENVFIQVLYARDERKETQMRGTARGSKEKIKPWKIQINLLS